MRDVPFPVRFAFLATVLASPTAFAQGGLPPNAGQVIREAASKPRLTGVRPGKASGGPRGCLMRDASFALLGGNLGPSADGRRLVASRRGARVGSVTILAWAASRIDARLNLGVDLEGDTVTLDLVDAEGAPASFGGGVSLPVCFRDQTFIGGTLRLPTCSNQRRQFRVVAEGPSRLERVLSVAPHAPAAPYGFSSIAQGSWVVSAREVPPGAAPPPGTLSIRPPSGAVPAIPGCTATSLGLDPRSRTVVISNAQRRATGVDFVELTLSLPHPDPGALGRDFSATPTPGTGLGTLPPPDFRGAFAATPTPGIHLVAPPSFKPAFPTATPTPAR